MFIFDLFEDNGSKDPYNRSPYDRGGADAWYHRGKNPHKIVNGKEVKLTDPAEIAEYLKGYEAEGVTNKYQGKTYESDISGLMHAAKYLNRVFRITAKTAEGDTKKFKVRAQSERVAREKFLQHYSQAEILNVEEVKVNEGDNQISVKELGNVIADHIESRLPQLFKRYGYEVMADAIMSVAEKNAGIEELKPHLVSSMMREVLDKVRNRLQEMDAHMYPSLKQQGINARRDGHKETDNPFSEGSHEYKQWQQGWREANEEEHKVRNTKSSNDTVIRASGSKQEYGDYKQWNNAAKQQGYDVYAKGAADGKYVAKVKLPGAVFTEIVGEFDKSSGSGYLYTKSKMNEVFADQQQENFGDGRTADELNIGDDVIIAGAVQFQGATGIIDSFGRDKRFVVVNLYNHGKHSFHSSDVEGNEYADSDEEEAELNRYGERDHGLFGDDDRDDDDDLREGYTLKKTAVYKELIPGDPDEYLDDILSKDTDYDIINNKTRKVVGTASWTTDDYMGPGALKITMNNGATRYLDIWDSEKGNPQTAFNRFVKDPRTAKKYKDQGVAEDNRFDEPLTGYHIVYRKSNNPVVNTPSFETRDAAQKYLMTRMFDNHQDYRVVHTANVGVTETSDYFRRREREEAIISGQKPARKRKPAQTSDYARRREQEKNKEQGVAEGMFDMFKSQPLPTKPETVTLGKFEVNVIPRQDRGYIGFAWHDSQGKENYTETGTRDLKTRKELMSIIKDEILYVEKQIKLIKNQNVSEDASKKNAVRRLQKMLNRKYDANLDVDGILGPLTLKSINKFMPDAKIEPADQPNKTPAVQGKKIKKTTGETKLDEKCWDTHKQVGMKKKGSKMVPNCVPKESIDESKQYYNVIGTAEKELKSNFGMEKDQQGWHLTESATPQQRLDALRAFGSPLNG